ncbi:MAG: response regulator [Deltaproteobacteria bacterium]|nr:response regulator [Deltaproteobacteria bacterium]
MQSHGSEDRVRVLVVDDDDALRKAVCRVLHLAGIVAEDFPDGEQAFLRLRQITPESPASAACYFDGAILDLKMPGWNGVQTARALLSIEPRLPLIIWSGGAPPALAAEARSLEPYAFLEKPCDPAELVRVVRSLRPQPPARS